MDFISKHLDGLGNGNRAYEWSHCYVQPIDTQPLMEVINSLHVKFYLRDSKFSHLIPMAKKKCHVKPQILLPFKKIMILS